MQKLTVIKDFYFSAAHSLSKVSDDHKCKRLHGHNYRVRIECTGPLDRRDMVCDFADVSVVIKPLIESLDHRNINDVTGFSNTTSEFMCQWFYVHAADYLPFLSAVEVWETEACGARLEV